MNETPETDALAQLLHNKCSHSESCYYEMRIHARKLERERNEARADLEFRRDLFKLQEQQLNSLRGQLKQQP